MVALQENVKLEFEKLKQRAEILLSQIELNSKKIRNAFQNDHRWDIRRISANTRMINELEYIAAVINEIWENPERGIVAFN
jgi:hypothetical protein